MCGEGGVNYRLTPGKWPPCCKIRSFPTRPPRSGTLKKVVVVVVGGSRWCEKREGKRARGREEGVKDRRWKGGGNVNE